MDDLLQIVLIVFMVFLCLLCMFSIVMIVRDVVRESKSKKKEYQPREEDAPLPERPTPTLVVVPQAEAQSLATEVPTTPVVVPLPNLQDDENAVVFSNQSYTMEEKYSTLSSEYKFMFDDIVRHALSKPNVKEYKHNGSFDYKDGSYKVLRMTIRRGEIVCEFNFINRDFLNYASTSNVKMKQSSTAIRVQELATVGVVKDGIDLVCNQINADREYKKEQSRARRREKRRQQTVEILKEEV